MASWFTTCIVWHLNMASTPFMNRLRLFNIIYQSAYHYWRIDADCSFPFCVKVRIVALCYTCHTSTTAWHGLLRNVYTGKCLYLEMCILRNLYTAKRAVNCALQMAPTNRQYFGKVITGCFVHSLNDWSANDTKNGTKEARTTELVSTWSRV